MVPGIFLFCIHLGLLGYLVYKSGYIPKVLGVLLVIAGLGYLIVFSFPRLQYGIFDDYFFGGSDIYALAFDKGLEDSRTELRVFFNPMLSPSLAIQGTNYLLSQTQV